jgi:O-antigen/teichoic acid export membrane protein
MALQGSKLVLVNTCAQYFRAILNIVLSFYATRLILKVLGVDDYGVYTLIAGVVSILSFITTSLVITTQRYLSVAQGENNVGKSKVIFNNSFLLHIVIGVVIILVFEAISPLLFNGFLLIPPTSLNAAIILYHIVVAILFFTLVASPFRAVLVSHENIIYITVVEILNSIFKLLIAFVLMYIDSGKLVVYGLLMMFIQFFDLLALSVYCYSKYEECIFPSVKLIDKSYLRGLFSFAGWTMYNLVCNLGRTQGLSILLNHYKGPAINTAYGLGFQVSGGLGQLSQSILNAINPKLMKAGGSGDRDKMFRMAEIESKMAFFLLSAAAIPCLFELPSLLELWLDEVPQYAVLFCRMVIFAALFDILTVGLGAVNQASGDIKKYTIIIYTLKLSTLLVAIVLFLQGYEILYIAVAYVLIELLTSVLRLPIVKSISNISIREFVEKVFMKEFLPVVVLVSSCFFITSYLGGEYRFILTFILSVLLYIVAISLFGLCDDEKKIINSLVKRHIFK